MSQQVEFFVFDGTSSQHVGIVIQGPPKFTAPEPRVTTVQVPGRNGDLVFYDGSYNNVSCEVSCYVLDWQVYSALAAVNKWLSARGYLKLVFDGDGYAYRMARVANGAEVAARLKLLNPFDLTFDCKPQRFLESGNAPVRFVSSGVLDNPGVGGLPIVRVYGTGTVRIGDALIEVDDVDGYVDIDCETQNAYKGLENKNGDVSCDTFPSLQPGRNSVIMTGDVTRVDITPRWFTL